MTPALLISIGTALYGEHWKTPLAVDLGISDRTLRRWANGHFEIPDRIAWDLLRVIQEREPRLAEAALELLAIIKTLPTEETKP